MSPSAGIHVGGFSFEQIVRHHAELHTGATAHKHHFIPFRYVEQFFEKRLRFVHHCHKFFAAVRNFKNRKACAGKITDGFNGVVDSELTHN